MRDPARAKRRARRDRAGEAAPMDPVALTMAVWLGLIASVTGVVRLAENAAFEARTARGEPGIPADTPQPDGRTFAFGG